MKLVSKIDNPGFVPIFERKIIGNPKEYCDLCVIKSYVSLECFYIKENDLYSLLFSKGITKEAVSICDMGFSSMIDCFNENFYIKYHDIMKLGSENLPISYTLKK